MSQTLTKPILLDETGQAIAGKLDTNSAAIVDALDDIKDAIGTSSEFIPVMIKVVTPPTKTIYKVGEHLDLSGMVVNLIGTNGVNIDVTQACTFVPANGATLTSSNTSVAISYHYAADNLDFSTSQALTIRELDSIAVTTPPIKTAYQTGETLDLTGIVVTATYSDGYTANVTADCIFSPANGTILSSSDTNVGVNYTEGSITKSTSVAIGVKELVSIAVTHIPTKTSYHAGETLDLSGLVVTATYDDTSSIDVTNNCVFSPANGAVLTTANTSITITYTEGSVTKTTTQAIVVAELSSIAITTPPTIVDYSKNDSLDLTGMVVTATYSDGTTSDVTALCTFNPADGATLSTSDTGVTATYTENGITKTAVQAITVLPPIYGAEWDGTATTAWTRTDDAANFSDPNPYYVNMTGNPSSPFDNISPWKDMAVVEDNSAGSLVSIPKFYYKLTQDGSKIKIQITNEPVNGYHISPAHMDRGDGIGERDVVYVGRFHCVSGCKSQAGATETFTTAAAARYDIHSLGTEIWQMDFTIIFTLWLLYLVEYADWNSQAKISYGNGSKSGQSNNIPYHTGTAETARNSTTSYLQYRYITGLWAQGMDWMDLCGKKYNSQTNKHEFYVILKPNVNPSIDNALFIDQVPTGGNNYPTAFKVIDKEGAFPMFLPSAVGGGSGSTYSCDTCYMENSYDIGTLQGHKGGTDSGMFAMFGSGSWSNGSARLMKLPNS